MDLRELLAADPEGKGPRPGFFDDPNVDRVLRVAITLAQELADTRMRLDAMERLLAERGVIMADAADNYAPGTEAESSSRSHQDHFIVIAQYRFQTFQIPDVRSVHKNIKMPAKIPIRVE